MFEYCQKEDCSVSNFTMVTCEECEKVFCNEHLVENANIMSMSVAAR